MLAGIAYAIFGLIELIVGLRFIFRLIGANPGSGFVDWVYSWSNTLVAPFAGIFGQDATATGTTGAVTSSVFDWTALIALLIYGLLAGIIVRLMASATTHY